MKEGLCVGVLGICFMLLIGIIGNVECGASLWQLLWCVPVFAVMGFCALYMEFENRRELRRYYAMKKRKTNIRKEI